MIGMGRPSWPGRSPLDPVSIRAVFWLLWDEVLDWFMAEVLETAPVKKEKDSA